jgi:hypothetical protein
MYLIKHKSISVFINVNGVYKAWGQCESPQIFHTEQEVETFCKIARVKDAVPYPVYQLKVAPIDVMFNQDYKAELYYAPTYGDYGTGNAFPEDEVKVYPMSQVSNPLCQPIVVKYEDLIYEF